MAKQRTAEQMLDSISFDTLVRSVRREGTYYYKSTMDSTVRVKFNLSECTLSILRKTGFSYSTVTEELSYNYRTKKVRKTYSHRHEKLTQEYHFTLDEEENFQLSTVLDECYPTVQDFIKLYQLKDLCRKDMMQWRDEMYAIAKARALKKYIEYQKYLNRYNRYNKKRKSKT